MSEVDILRQNANSCVLVFDMFSMLLYCKITLLSKQIDTEFDFGSGLISCLKKHTFLFQITFPTVLCSHTHSFPCTGGGGGGVLPPLAKNLDIPHPPLGKIPPVDSTCKG